MRSRSAVVLAVLLCLLAGAGCAPGAGGAAPQAHPMGPDCTWPADLDPQRDGLAVLAVAAAGYTTDLVLLDVATGGVRARCAGLAPGGGMPAFREDGARPQESVPTASVLLPAVSPDRRWALSAAGVVELSTGRVVPEPAPGWRAAALPGAGRVLRQRVAEGAPAREDDYDPTNWCLAPRPDAPAEECAPLPATGPGFPAVGTDGNVGWAPAVPVPVRLDRLSGVLQTDGSRVVQLNLDRDRPDHAAVVDASGRAGLLGRSEFRFAPGNIGFEELPGWYTVEELTATSATARLHSGASSWTEVEGLQDDLRTTTSSGAAVVAGGTAVIVVLRRQDTAVFVQISENAPARVVTTLPLGPSSEAQSGGVPQIFAWPDPASPVEP